jgi:hypothetical protein
MPKRESTWIQALLLVVVFGVIRWLSISYASDAFHEDPDAYRKLAIGLAKDHVFGEPDHPTAFRPPLYPWLLSWAVKGDSHSLSSFGVQCIHTFLGASTCLGVWWLFRSYGRRASESTYDRWRTWGAWCSSGLTALDPILIRQSQLLMTETLATALAVLVLVAIETWSLKPSLSNGAFVGLCLGLSILCRPTALVWLAFLAILQIAGCVFETIGIKTVRDDSGTRSAMRDAIGCAAALMIGSLVVIVPWVMRNQREMGRPIVTTTHGGYTLLLANNDPLYDHLESSWSRTWDEAKFHEFWLAKSRGLPELEQDKLASSLAWECIANRPSVFVKSCIARLGWFWAPWPNQSGSRTKLVIGVWYALVFVGALTFMVTLWRRRGTRMVGPYLPGLLLIASLMLVHTVYWSNMRMRSVAMPFVAILAASAVFPPTSKRNAA